MSKEPELSFFQQLLAFASLAGLGGVVHYLTTLKTGKKFKWPSFFIELICSAFVGVAVTCQNLGSLEKRRCDRKKKNSL